jgi:hypothetical protein
MTKEIIWHEVKAIPVKGINGKPFTVKPQDKLLLRIGSKPTYTSYTRGIRKCFVKKHILDDINAIFEWRERKCKKRLQKKLSK